MSRLSNTRIIKPINYKHLLLIMVLFKRYTLKLQSWKQWLIFHVSCIEPLYTQKHKIRTLILCDPFPIVTIPAIIQSNPNAIAAPSNQWVKYVHEKSIGCLVVYWSQAASVLPREIQCNEDMLSKYMYMFV